MSKKDTTSHAQLTHSVGGVVSVRAGQPEKNMSQPPTSPHLLSPTSTVRDTKNKASKCCHQHLLFFECHKVGVFQRRAVCGCHKRALVVTVGKVTQSVSGECHNESASFESVQVTQVNIWEQ